MYTSKDVFQPKSSSEHTYITRCLQEGSTYEEALREAQEDKDACQY